MWYKVTATFESGKTRTYEVKGFTEAMMMVARLKATSDVVTSKDKLVDYKITKSED